MSVKELNEVMDSFFFIIAMCETEEQFDALLTVGVGKEEYEEFKQIVYEKCPKDLIDYKTLRRFVIEQPELVKKYISNELNNMVDDGKITLTE